MKTLPDPEMTTKRMDTRAYLIRLQDKASRITISDLTLYAPKLHGTIFGFGNHELHLHHLRIKETLWTGIRTFGMKQSRIHDCEFIDADGHWKRGSIPGNKGGITGGAIFAIWIGKSEIAHNRFVRTRMEKEHNFLASRDARESRIASITILSLSVFPSSSYLKTMRTSKSITTCSILA